MCGRYSITLPPEAICHLFQVNGELPNCWRRPDPSQASAYPLSSIGSPECGNTGGVVLFPDYSTLRYADDAGISLLLPQQRWED